MFDERAAGRCWLLRGSIDYGRNRFEAASAAFERVRKLRPRDGHATNAFGLVALQRGAPIRAEALFQGLLEVEERAETRNNLGAALLAQGRIDEARANFERALEARPSLEIASLNLAVCLERAGETSAAADSYRRYVASGGDLNTRNVRALRGRIQRLLHGRKTGERTNDVAQPQR